MLPLMKGYIMENKEYKDLKELIELSDEAETLSEDECFHSKDMLAACLRLFL